MGTDGILKMRYNFNWLILKHSFNIIDLYDLNTNPQQNSYKQINHIKENRFPTS